MVFFSVPAASSVKGQNIDLYVAAIGDCIRKSRSFFKRSKSDEFKNRHNDVDVRNQKKRVSRMWENAYLSIKIPKASRDHCEPWTMAADSSLCLHDCSTTSATLGLGSWAKSWILTWTLCYESLIFYFSCTGILRCYLWDSKHQLWNFILSSTCNLMALNIERWLSILYPG